MHVVYVSREFPPSKRCGGIGSYVRDISRELAARGHQVTVIAASDDTTHSYTEDAGGVRVIRLPGGDFALHGEEAAGDWVLTRHWRIMQRFWSYRRRVADCIERLIEENRAELVEFPEFGCEAAVWVQRPRRIPKVIRLHTPSTLDRRTANRKKWPLWQWYRRLRALREYTVLDSVTAISSCSDALAKFVSQDTGLPTDNFQVIYNPIQCPDWAQPVSLEMLHDDRDSSEVLFAGTVVASKGVNELIEAARMLRNQGRAVKLTVVGRLGRDGQALRDKAHLSPDMNEWLTFTGLLTRDDLQQRYLRASAVCLPSWWDNCPYTCLEAMASGGLVIGSSAGGMAEIIRDGIDGFLVPPKDPQRLAQTIARVLDLLPNKKLQMRKEAQNRIRQEFDSEVIVPQMLRFYERVIYQWKSEKSKANPL